MAENQNSPASVLRSIARRIGCAYGEIEDRVSVEMGGEPLVFQPDAAKRLDAIRKKLMTPEAECVIEQASRMLGRPSLPKL